MPNSYKTMRHETTQNDNKTTHDDNELFVAGTGFQRNY